MKNKERKAVWFLILHCLIFFHSLSGVISKLASQQEFLSLSFIGLYILEIVILFGYAILWQQVLKHLSLTVAFANKAVSMIWTMLWGVSMFQETLTLRMVIGLAVVSVGVLVVVSNDG